jgi:hypothetical protein
MISQALAQLDPVQRLGTQKSCDENVWSKLNLSSKTSTQFFIIDLFAFEVLEFYLLVVVKVTKQ